MKARARVDEELVRAVPEPQFTRSWHPISHSKLLDAMHNSLSILRANVVKASYTMSEDGLNLFGTWELDVNYKDSPLMVGFRNSMKKMFAVGFCAGRFVVACSNMQFGGDFVEFRKHTSGLNIEVLHNLCNRSFVTIRDRMIEFADWHESLRNVKLPREQSKILTHDCMEYGVFPPSKFAQFLEAHREEKMLYGPNLYSFYGGVTRIIKDSSLFKIQQTTGALNIMVNDWAKYLQ